VSPETPIMGDLEERKEGPFLGGGKSGGRTIHCVSSRGKQEGGKSMWKAFSPEGSQSTPGGQSRKLYRGLWKKPFQKLGAGGLSKREHTNWKLSGGSGRGAWRGEAGGGGPMLAKGTELYGGGRQGQKGSRESQKNRTSGVLRVNPSLRKSARKGRWGGLKGVNCRKWDSRDECFSGLPKGTKIQP